MSCIYRYLCCLLWIPLLAQTPPGPLNLVVVAGEGAANHTGSRTAQAAVVRVEDGAGKPVPGAAVVFSLPTDGPSGEFADQSKTLVVTTDARGEASTGPLRLNTVPGRLQIHVNASWRGAAARTNVTQFVMNVPGKSAGGGKKVGLILLAVVGAAAAGGAAYAFGGKSSAATPTPAAPPPVPIGITPTPGTVGGPR
jgi:hypothetical protein